MKWPFLAASLLTGLAAAAPACLNLPYAIEESKLTMGPQHHPMGRPLPAQANFHQPDRCIDNIWFFDQNRNGQPDPEEVRVFGANRQVDCGSCHGESTDGKSPTSAEVFLRQDAARLCLVCHNI